jgi:trehalose-6-phosphate synthase
VKVHSRVAVDTRAPLTFTHRYPRARLFLHPSYLDPIYIAHTNMSSDAPTKLVSEKPNEGRLLLVSNRLPITIKRADEGKYEMSMSSGGLVSGLSGLSKTTTFQWYGWPGLEVPEDEVAGLKDQLRSEYNAVPIMLDDELADRHYNGFSSQSFLRQSIHRH